MLLLVLMIKGYSQARYFDEHTVKRKELYRYVETALFFLCQLNL